MLPDTPVNIDNAYHGQLMAEDAKIEAHNVKLQKYFESLTKTEKKVEKCAADVSRTSIQDQPELYQRRLDALSKAQKSRDGSNAKYQKEVRDGQAKFQEMGSGKVTICIPHEEVSIE